VLLPFGKTPVPLVALWQSNGRTDDEGDVRDSGDAVWLWCESISMQGDASELDVVILATSEAILCEGSMTGLKVSASAARSTLDYLYNGWS